MNVREALHWFGDGERLAWRSLWAGTLGRAGLRSAVGAFCRPLTAPSRYPEYDVFIKLLNQVGLDLSDDSTWLLDVGSPKLFSLLLADRNRANVVATDIWQPAINEAEALRGGLTSEASARLRLGSADIREPLPDALLPPGGKFEGAFSMSVIEHVEPTVGGDRLALECMANVVRESGTVLVSVPVDTLARAEYHDAGIYGRAPEDGDRVFFQRVYDGASLRALCDSVSPRLTLAECVVVEWPNHAILKLQPKFPSLMGFAGAAFPFLAERFVVGEPAPTIPDILSAGDAILRFTRST